MIVAYDATSVLGHSGIEVYARELMRGVSSIPELRIVLSGAFAKTNSIGKNVVYNVVTEVRNVLIDRAL